MTIEIKNYNPLKKFLKKNFPDAVMTIQTMNNIAVKEQNGLYLYNYTDAVLVPRGDPVIRLCRGLVLDKTGKVFNFPFTRFFNYHEAEKDDVDLNTAEAVEKLDGSLISCWHDGTDWKVTTRGCFPPSDSGVDYDKLFREVFNGFDKLYGENTYIFELIHPEDPHVTRYSEKFCALIGARNINNLREYTQDNLDEKAKEIGARRPKRFKITDIESCHKLFDDMREDEEGLVVVDQNFNRFKLKQQSYLKMQRILRLKDQDILNYVLGRSKIDADFDGMPEVEEKIKKVKEMIDKLDHIIAESFPFGHTTQKSFALEALKFPWKSVLFHMNKGEAFIDYPFKYKQLKEWLEPRSEFTSDEIEERTRRALFKTQEFVDALKRSSLHGEKF